MKSFFLAHPKIFFSLFLRFPRSSYLLTLPPHPPGVVYFPSLLLLVSPAASWVYLCLCFLIFNLGLCFFCLFFFLLSPPPIWNISCFPLHNLSPILYVFVCNIYCSFILWVVLLHITVSVFVILHYLDCWNYSISLSHFFFF